MCRQFHTIVREVHPCFEPCRWENQSLHDSLTHFDVNGVAGILGT